VTSGFHVWPHPVPQALLSFGYIGASLLPLAFAFRWPSTVSGSGPSPKAMGLYCFVNLILGEQQSGIPDLYTHWAVWKLSVPCGKDKCAGLIEIRAVMRKESSLEDAVGLAAKIYANDVPCNRELHRHTGPSIETLSPGFEIDQDWAVLCSAKI
jgi:hypothetical protein